MAPEDVQKQKNPSDQELRVSKTQILISVLSACAAIASAIAACSSYKLSKENRDWQKKLEAPRILFESTTHIGLISKVREKELFLLSQTPPEYLKRYLYFLNLGLPQIAQKSISDTKQVQFNYVNSGRDAAYDPVFKYSVFQRGIKKPIMETALRHFDLLAPGQRFENVFEYKPDQFLIKTNGESRPEEWVNIPEGEVLILSSFSYRDSTGNSYRNDHNMRLDMKRSAAIYVSEDDISKFLNDVPNSPHKKSPKHSHFRS